MSARREARAAAAAFTDDGRPPAELFDPEHPVWSDDALYAAFCERMGWGPNQMPITDRLGMTGRTHPHNRRNYASEAWAVAGGVYVLPGWPGLADWERLAEMGLIGD